MDRFVGRTSELESLRQVARQAAEGSGGIAFVSGPPGIGKSALVQEFVGGLDSARMRVLRGYCSEQFGVGEAYLPFKQVLGELVGNSEQKRDRSGYLALLQEVAPSWIQMVPVAGSVVAAGIETHAALQRRRAEPAIEIPSRERMLSEYAQVLYAVAERKPTVVILEDLHWADPSSIDVLNYLARRVREHALLVIGTYRHAEVEASAHPLQKAVVELDAAGIAHRLMVSPFGEDQIETFLATAFPGHQLTAEFQRFLREKTGGHPLFLRELLRFATETGVIVQRGGSWQIAGTFDDLVLPERVASMIRRSLQLLNPDDLRLLRLASVEGEVFTSDVLQALTGEDEFALDERLTKLDAASDLITYIGDLEYPDRELASRYRFAHALYQNTLYEELTGKQRVLLHRKAAERLEQRYARKPDLAAVQIAFHLDRGRDYERAAGWYRRAGDKAAGEMGFAEAASHYRRARECLDQVRPDALDELGPLFQAEGQSRMAASDFGALLDLWEELERRAERAGEDGWRARALGQQAQLLLYTNRVQAAERRLEQGLALARASGDEHAQARLLHTTWLAKHSYTGEVSEGMAVGRALKTLVQRIQDPVLTTDYTSGLGIVLHHRGDGRRAIPLLEEAIELARTARSGINLLINMEFCGMAAAGVGEYRRAYDVLSRARKLATEIGEAFTQAEVPNILGYIHSELGDSRRAQELDSESLQIARSLHRVEPEANALVNLGDRAYAAGDRHGALAYYENALAQRQRDAGNWWRYTTRMLCSRSALWLREGDLSKAWADAEEALALAWKTRAKKNIAKARLLQARIVHVAGSEHTLGVAPDPLRLATVAARLARKVGNPRLLWSALEFQGEMLTARGDEGEARASLGEALGAARRMLEQAPEPRLAASLQASAAYQRLDEAVHRLQ